MRPKRASARDRQAQFSVVFPPKSPVLAAPSFFSQLRRGCLPFPAKGTALSAFAAQTPVGRSPIAAASVVASQRRGCLSALLREACRRLQLRCNRGGGERDRTDDLLLAK